MDISKFSKKDKNKIWLEIQAERNKEAEASRQVEQDKRKAQKEQNLKRAEDYLKKNPYDASSEIVNISFSLNQNAFVECCELDDLFSIDFEDGFSADYQADELIHEAFFKYVEIPKLSNINRTNITDCIKALQDNIKILKAFEPFNLKVDIVANWNGGNIKYDVNVSSKNGLSNYKRKKYRALVRAELKNICDPRHYIFQDFVTKEEYRDSILEEFGVY